MGGLTGAGRRRNPPTTQATGAPGNGGRDDKPMGGPRTAPPPRPQRGTVADDGSAETPPRHTAGTDGTRLEHGALEVDLSNARDPGSEASHGATGEQDGRETKEGDKTQQRALPARGNNGIGNEARGPPERLRAFNVCGRHGGVR